MTYTEAAKKATYKYRKNNPEKTKILTKLDADKYYAKHHEEILAKKKLYYLKKKNENIVFDILITIVEKEENPDSLGKS